MMVILVISLSSEKKLEMNSQILTPELVEWNDDNSELYYLNLNLHYSRNC